MSLGGSNTLPTWCFRATSDRFDARSGYYDWMSGKLNAAPEHSDSERDNSDVVSGNRDAGAGISGLVESRTVTVAGPTYGVELAKGNHAGAKSGATASSDGVCE